MLRLLQTKIRPLNCFADPLTQGRLGIIILYIYIFVLVIIWFYLAAIRAGVSEAETRYFIYLLNIAIISY
jgi:hypothetical protein